jgi:hypothetical protein
VDSFEKLKHLGLVVPEIKNHHIRGSSQRDALRPRPHHQDENTHRVRLVLKTTHNFCLLRIVHLSVKQSKQPFTSRQWLIGRIV